MVWTSQDFVSINHEQCNTLRSTSAGKTCLLTTGQDEDVAVRMRAVSVAHCSDGGTGGAAAVVFVFQETAGE